MSLAFVAGLLGAGAARADDSIRIAVTAGPHAQIAEVAKKVAEREGLHLTIVEFQDYIQPNAALDAGDVQARRRHTAAAYRNPLWFVVRAPGKP